MNIEKLKSIIEECELENDKISVKNRFHEVVNFLKTQLSFDMLKSITAVDLGDEIAKNVVDRYLYYVAIGLANVINALQPEAVCIGGGISGQGEKILKPIRDMVKAERYSVYAEKQAAILPAQLGNDAGIIGAALLDE